METFIDKYGQKRSGVLVQCKQCQKDFWTRKNQPASCCSLECKYKNSRNRTVLKCAGCGKDFERSISGLKHSRSKIYFCSRKCKDDAQKIGGIAEIMPPHFGTGKAVYRRFFHEDELVCQRCGYTEFGCSVNIHHLDQNRENNKKENLIPLCANCHMAFHNKKWSLNEIHGR